MAYQPVQLPNGLGIAGGLDRMRESLRRAQEMEWRRAEQEREDALLAEQKKRQGDMDFQQAYIQASALAEKGDIEGAKMLLSPYVHGMRTVDKDKPLELDLGAGPGTQARPAQPQQQPVANPAIPAQPDYAKMYGFPAEVEGEAGVGMPPVPGQQPRPPVQGGSALPDTVEFQGQQLPIPPGATPDQVKMRAAIQQEKVQNQVRARKLLEFQRGGQSFTFDPMAREIQARERATAVREQNALAFDQAMQGADPMTLKYAAEIRPMVAMSAEPVDPQDIMNYVRQRAQQDAQTQAAAAKDAEGLRRWNAEREWDREKFERGEAGKDRRAAMVATRQANDPYKEASATTTTLGGIRGEVKDFLAAHPYEKTAANLSDYTASLRAIESGNDKLIQDAIFKYGKAVAGVGSFTQQEQEAIINRTGGTIEQLKNRLAQIEAGKYTPETVATFREALKVKAEGERRQMAAIQQAYRAKFRQGYAFQGVQRNVADEEQSLFGRYGLAVEPPPDDAGGVSYGTPGVKREREKTRDEKRAAAKKEADRGMPFPRDADPLGVQGIRDRLSRIKLKGQR